jgi:4-hydroxy-3-methylbut-2-enyl diphosphate reductase
VQGVVSALQALGAGELRSIEGQPENITFSLPKALRIPATNV